MAGETAVDFFEHFTDDLSDQYQAIDGAANVPEEPNGYRDGGRGRAHCRLVFIAWQRLTDLTDLNVALGEDELDRLQLLYGMFHTDNRQ